MPKKENTLHGLLITKLKALLDVEEQITKALPAMVKNASDSGLKAAFEEYLEETQSQAQRVRGCLEAFGEKPKALKSEAIRGLIQDAKWVMANVEKGPALDAALIAAAQYVEHYEMAGYGTASEWAKIMEHNDAAKLLSEIRDEEEAADEKLNDLATDKINENVEMGMEEMEEK